MGEDVGLVGACVGTVEGMPVGDDVGLPVGSRVGKAVVTLTVGSFVSPVKVGLGVTGGLVG